MELGNFNALLNYAKYVSTHVERVIYELLDREPQKLYEASKHLIKAGGKRLRPLALVLSGRMYGLPENLGFIAGAAVEILHNFTLVHDDIMDKDTFRRGVPTVHVLYGVDMAILAGDTLFAKAYEALGLLERYVPADRLVKAFKELTWAAVTVAEGQALDMDFENRLDVSINEYLTMVYKKTAALFKASLSIGALLAGAPEKELELLSKFAEGVGIAFQIRDDVLGLTGDEKILGKPVYSDLREGKKTVLVIYALNKLSNEERKKVIKVLGNRSASTDELRKVAELIISTGAVDYAEKLANEYLSKGLNALSMTNPQDLEAREMLKNLALYVTSRSY